MATSSASDEASDNDINGELILVCAKALREREDGFTRLKSLLDKPGIKVDTADNDGMTPLMYAAYCGHLEACKLLFEKGADINNNCHSEGYTALMFATMAGHPDIADFFLRNGAKIDAVNRVGKTASQIGGFIGQHEVVQVINNFFPVEELHYYTKPQGLETSPKLHPSLVQPLHTLIISVNLNPVGLLLLVQSLSPSLLDHTHMVCNVLKILCDKAMKHDQEPFALKLHYLSCTMKEFDKFDGVNSIIKNFLIFSDEGLPLEVERFLRQSLKTFSHTHSIVLKQMVATLAKISLGQSPSTLSVFSAYLLGNRTYDEHNYCATCGSSGNHLKKCAKCTRVFYCGVQCQTLAWTLGNHKKLCKKWTKGTTGKQK